MKKILSAVLILFLFAASFSSCGTAIDSPLSGSDSPSPKNQQNDKPEDDSAPTLQKKIPDEHKHEFIPQKIDNATAVRFLNKATFGATQRDVKALKRNGVIKWLDEQLRMPVEDNIYLKKMILMAKQAEPDEYNETIESYLADNDIVFNKKKASFHSPRYRMSSWFDIALTSKDQLRQKVTYALSQIIVESDFEPVFTRRAEALAAYFDILQKYAFGNYKDLLYEISLNSAMSMFLTFNGNKKLYKNKAGIFVYPDENYARELMQLFSIGLNRLNIDATPLKDEKGNLIPSYTQQDVNELSRVFTGWDLKRNAKFGQSGFTRGDLTHSVEFTSKYHDFGEKILLGNKISANLTGKEDIKRAVDIIFANENVAPFISKKLIKRLTKSNPTPDYIRRVATVFKNTGGDLKEVVKAIFLDKEIWEDFADKKIVKLKEPLLAYTQFLRAFNAKAPEFWYFCGYGGPIDENASNCNLIKNRFLFNDPRGYLNQGAGLAMSVFNFYDDDFIPNNEDFKSSKSTAPETEIYSDTIFIRYHNRIYGNLLQWEKNIILNSKIADYKDFTPPKRYETLNDYIKDAPARGYIPLYYIGADKMILDTSEELNIMESVIDGNTDGDFKNLQDYGNSDYNDDEKALSTLIDHLDEKLTGSLLSEEQKNTIYENLKNKIYKKISDDSKYDKKMQLLKNTIFPAITAIVTSSTYMSE